MTEAHIPEKLYFKIGEVAAITSLRPSVLRFWETEFDFLRPQKSRSGQRLYGKKEVELISEVKHLLYTEKLTIEGVKRRISLRGKKAAPQVEQPPAERTSLLLEIKRDLQEMRALLEK